MNVIRDNISRFESNKRLVYLCLGIIITFSIITMIFQLVAPEPYTDYGNIKKRVENCSLSKFNLEAPAEMRVYMLCVSDHVFHNVRILPFIYSVLLLPLSYLLAVKITNRVFIGLTTVFILATSYDFVIYSVSAAYDQLWALTLIGSIYCILRKPILSIPLFVFSILCKALPLAYLPMIIFFIIQTQYSVKKKIGLSLGFISIIIPILLDYLRDSIIDIPSLSFSWHPVSLFVGFWLWVPLMFRDVLVVSFVPFVLVFLCFKRKKRYALSLFSFMFGILLTVPFLDGITNMSSESYRFVPFFIFYGIGLGMLVLYLIERRTKNSLVV